MKLTLPILLLLSGLSIQALAQQESNRITTDVTKITFFNPGVSYEKSIGQQSTLHAHLFLNTSLEYSYSSALGSEFRYSFDPALLLQYRYYYNYKQRQQKEKRTEMNSMNYISPVFQTSLSKAPITGDHPFESKRRPINVVGAVWGMQRNYAKRFSLDLNIGLGYMFTTATAQGTGRPLKETVWQFTLPGQFNLGFWLNKQ